MSNRQRDRIEAKLNALLALNIILVRKETHTMAAIDDLNTAVKTLQDAETVEEQQLTDIVAALRAGNTTNDPAIEAAAVAIGAVKDKLASFPASQGTVPAP